MKILHDATDGERAFAVEENLVDLFRSMSPLAGAECQEIYDRIGFRTAPGRINRHLWRAE